MIKLRSAFSLFCLILFCTVLSLSVLRVYIHQGVPITHDGENHLARFANYKIALKEGQWPPRFAPNLFHRYGYPVFNYNYPLPNILSVPFSLIKISYEFTFKFIMSAAVVALVVGFWMWLTQLGMGTWAKIAAVTSIIVSPYLVQTVIYRGSIGEVLGLACLSWWLLWVEKLRNQKTGLLSPMTVIGGVLVGCFFLSHNVTVLFGTPLILIYSIWRLWQKKEQLLSVGGATALGIGLSLWFWLPALAEQSAIIISGSSLAQQYLQHFPTLQQLLASPLQFGFSYLGAVDSLSFAFGFAEWVALFCAIGWAFAGVGLQQKQMSKTFNQFFWVMLVVTIGLLIFQLSGTSSIWQLIPLARFIQFPWRLGLFATLTSSALVAWVVQQNIRWQRIAITLALGIQLIIVWRLTPVGYLHKERVEYELFEQSTTTSNEDLPKNFTYQEFANWQPTARILEGEGSTSVQQWNGSVRQYTVVAVTPVTVVEPTMFFPGWETLITNKNSARSTMVNYLQNKEISGRIAYQLSPGMYNIVTRFTQWTWSRVIGNTVSLLTGLYIILVVGQWFLAHNHKK